MNTNIFIQNSVNLKNYTPKICPVLRMGNPLLLQRSYPVDDPTHPDTHKQVADLIQTILSIERAGGLAAPQIAYHSRIFIFSVPENRDPLYPVPVPHTVAINPLIIEQSNETFTDWERCFSLPDFVGKVERSKYVIMQYQTPEGITKTIEAQGYLSRLIQHETDHLDGILYPSRIKDFQYFGYVEEIRGKQLNS